MTPPIQSLVFDMDGVLADTSPCHAAAWEQIFRLIGIQAPAYHEIAGRSTRNVLEQFTGGLAPDHEQLLEWVRFKQLAALETLHTAPIEYDDTTPAITCLKQAGYAMSLATSASRASASLVLKRCGLEATFETIVCAEDMDRAKPDPAIFMLAMKRAGYRPASTLIIEDSSSGLAAALASGARVACVRSGHECDHPNFQGSFNNLLELTGSLT